MSLKHCLLLEVLQQDNVSVCLQSVLKLVLSPTVSDKQPDSGSSAPVGGTGLVKTEHRAQGTTTLLSSAHAFSFVVIIGLVR